MTAALLATKLQVPQPRPGLLARPRLLDRLSAGTARELTLVCTPPGFGKTALLADWAQGGRWPVAWLTVDAGDNDPARFWRHLVAALGPAAGPRPAGQLRQRDLRCTEREARVVLGQAVGADLPEAAVAVPTERTEGGVAGLQLAAVAAGPAGRGRVRGRVLGQSPLRAGPPGRGGPGAPARAAAAVPARDLGAGAAVGAVAAVPGLGEQLTVRELEVLGLLAAGRSNRRIAQELVVTLDTVKKHVSHVFDKLGSGNRTEAVARARQLGLLR